MQADLTNLHPAAQVVALIVMGVVVVAIAWVIATFIREAL